VLGGGVGAFEDPNPGILEPVPELWTCGDPIQARGLRIEDAAFAKFDKLIKFTNSPAVLAGSACIDTKIRFDK
jgi:hypothetical protein